MSIPNARPSAVGVDARELLAFIDALDRAPDIEPHGLIVQVAGQRIAEGYWHPHRSGQPRLLYSLSKTITASALALQVGEGRLTLDDLVSAYLPESFDGACEPLRALRIRHIASMASGHDRETFAEARAADPNDVVRGFLRIAPAAPPGELFAYNQPPVIALATILQKLAGERLVDYLRPRLFEPLGMGDVRSQPMANGLDPGFSSFYASLDAIARLGQCYLQDGVREGVQRLPSGWVTQASALQIPNPQRPEPDWRVGYGFGLWRSRHGYRGDGAFGQYMVVLPEQRAVIAMFACTTVMQRVLDLMWKHLLPAIDGVAATPDRVVADNVLVDRLATLRLPTASQRLAVSSTAEDWQGTIGTYRPEASHTDSHWLPTSIVVQNGEAIITEHDRRLALPLASDWRGSADGSVVASAARLADGRLAIDLVLPATPHRAELLLQPTGGNFTMRWAVAPIPGAGMPRFLTAMKPPP